MKADVFSLFLTEQLIILMVVNAMMIKDRFLRLFLRYQFQNEKNYEGSQYNSPNKS